MSCRRFRPLVALWVTGDLSARRARRVKAHVAGCDACRGLAARLLENASALAALAEQAPDAETLRLVRRGVLARLDGEGASVLSARPRAAAARLVWKPLLAAALVALAVAAAALLRRASQPATLNAAAVRPTAAPSLPTPAPSLPAPVEAAVTAAHARSTTTEPAAPQPGRRRARALSPEERRAAAEPIVIKVVTDDPDVVIYWLVDDKKG